MKLLASSRANVVVLLICVRGEIRQCRAETDVSTNAQCVFEDFAHGGSHQVTARKLSRGSATHRISHARKKRRHLAATKSHANYEAIAHFYVDIHALVWHQYNFHRWVNTLSVMAECARHLNYARASSLRAREWWHKPASGGVVAILARYFIKRFCVVSVN